MMAIHFEGFFQGYRDSKLFYQYWQSPQAKGALIITHGQGEHSGSYHRVVEALKSLPLDIYAWDLRGHGRSEGSRGFAQDFDDYCKDLEAFYKFLRTKKEFHNKDLYFLGHSMGGLIQLKSLMIHRQWPVKGQVLSSPLLGLALDVPIYKQYAAAVLRVLTPTLTLGNEISDSQLSRDPLVLQEYAKDYLRHKKIAAGVYLGFFEAFDVVEKYGPRLQIPTLFQISPDDPVINPEAVRKFYSTIDSAFKSQCHLKEYPGRKHELYNDLDREEIFSDLRAWFKF